MNTVAAAADHPHHHYHHHIDTAVSQSEASSRAKHTTLRMITNLIY
jgi:hypothetical protein